MSPAHESFRVLRRLIDSYDSFQHKTLKTSAQRETADAGFSGELCGACFSLKTPEKGVYDSSPG